VERNRLTQAWALHPATQCIQFITLVGVSRVTFHLRMKLVYYRYMQFVVNRACVNQAAGRSRVLDNAFDGLF
jgi:hypothetical protein